MKLRLLFVFVLATGVQTLVFAQTNFTSKASTNWNQSSTWNQTGAVDADGIPDGGDNVTIATGFTVNIDAASACSTLTMNGTGSLNFNTGSAGLTVGSTMTMNGTSQILGNSASRTLTLNGDFIIPIGQSGTFAGININQAAAKNFTVNGAFNSSNATGTKNLGNLIINGAGSWTASSTETFNVQNATLTDGSIIDGSSTSTLNILGNLSVVPGTGGNKTQIGRTNLNVNGTTTITGYLVFSNSASGTKTFNGTITVNITGTWDDTIGEDPVVNCNIVNNGYWPVPTGGNGVYTVNSGGTYTYTGSEDIGMSQLSVQGGSTVTNKGRLYLTRKNSSGLSITGGSTFINGNGGYITFTSAATSVNLGFFTNTVDFSTATNTVEYAYAGDQDVYPTTYSKVICSNGGTKSIIDNTVVNNSLTINDVTVVDIPNGNHVTGAGNLIMNGTSELDIASTGTVPELTGSGHTLAAGTTINFDLNSAQTAASSANYPYQNVTISGGNGSNLNVANVSLIKGDLTFTNRGDMNSNPVMTILGTMNCRSNATITLAANVTTGNFIYSLGTLDISGRTLTINGNDGTWTNNGGAITTTTTSQVVFTSGTNQQIGGLVATTFRNLTINNSNGVTLSNQDATASGVLTLTTGAVITGTNNMIVPSTGSVTRTTGFVQGNLQKYVATGATTVLYEIGTGTTYSPASIAFASVTTAGMLTASTTAGDHPDVKGSNIDPNLTVNRYWTLANNSVGFTTYSPTFTFITADKDALANTANFGIKRSDGLNWFTTTTGTRTANTTQFTAEPIANLSAGLPMDFQIGEQINTTGVINRQTGANNWSNKATWIQNRTGIVQFTSGSTAVTGSSGTLFLSELAAGDILMLQTSAGTIRGTVQTITTNTSLTLSAPAGSTANGGYGREYIPNAIGDIVTIGNSLLTDVATTITLDMNATVNSLSINTAVTPRGTAQVLTHTGTFSLTVQTDLTVNQPSVAANDNWNINGGSAVVNGNLTIGSGINTNALNASVVIASGSLTVGTNLIFSTGSNNGRETTAVLDMSGGAAKLNLGKDLIFVNNRGSLTSGTTSTFNFNRSATGQLIDFPGSNLAATSWTYNNIYCNNTSSDGLTYTATLTAANVKGDVRVQTGSLVQVDNSLTGATTKVFQVANNAIFRMTGTKGFPTGFTTYDLGATTPFGTVNYENTNNTAISLQSYGILQVVNSSQQFTLPAGLTVAGNLVMGDGNRAPSLVGGTGTLAVVGDVTIYKLATINAANITTFTVGGNWTNNGIFSESTRTVVFNGAGPSQPQVISGTAVESFYNLTISTTATTNIVQLQKDISVDQTLTLTQGGLSLNSNTLFITRNSTTAVSRTSGYVMAETSTTYGQINWNTGGSTGSFVFPFGRSSTEYIPFTFGISTAGSPNTGTMSITTYHTATNNTPYPAGVTNLNPGNNSANVVDRFWVITANGYTTTRPTATMVFTATPAEVGTITNLQAQRWSPANVWNAPITGQTNTATTATVSNVSSFSPWTLSGNNSPLPIELVVFEAAVANEAVDLHWVTASEVNNDYFTIEKSSDGESFENALTVKGAGTTTVKKNYTATDHLPLPGTSYYRLAQTDFDGRTKYSELVKVEFKESSAWRVYPNPSNGAYFNLQLTSLQANRNILIQVYNVTGAIAWQAIEIPDAAGRVSLTLVQPLTPGVYVIVLSDGESIQRQRLVVE